MKPNALTSCQSKKFYQTRQEAEDIATYLFYKKGLDLEIYKCNMCENFHLTRSKNNDK